jgi:putative two-component system response regulator
VARITPVAEVFDPLMSKRPYKEPWTREEAPQYLRDNAGSHFDPAVVDAFLRSQGETFAPVADPEPVPAVA